MKVGIKYCGGCNSKFDRVKVIESIKIHNTDLFFSYVNTSYEYDFIIVVNGCGVSCTDIRNLKTKNGFFEIYDDNIKEIQSRIEIFKNNFV